MLKFVVSPLLVLVLVVLCAANGALFRGTEAAKWAAQIRSHRSLESTTVARTVASELKLNFHGQVGSLPDTFLFSDPSLALKDAVSAADFATERRVDRDAAARTSSGRGLQELADLDVEEEAYHPALQTHPNVLWHSEQRPLRRVKRGGEQELFEDPSFKDQWYLVNRREKGKDHNVTGIWAQNVTGRGVVVSIVDDGLEMSHPDLVDSYNVEGSTDLNSNDRDPTPRYDRKDTNHHGTRCAGEIVSKPNNSVCGVGIAFGAEVSATRILDGDVSDSMEAAAFGFAPSINDIYSCSWGPDDDGKTVDGPRPLAKRALEHGIKYGRRGYGSLYVVASGNGGRHGDNCNFDGYANSIYTLTIGGVAENDSNPPYNEPCAATMAVGYSSAGHSHSLRAVTTTDLHHSCTDHHTGTSAAAPLAAGMLALALEVRPCLTWRDVQHLFMMTAVRIDSAAAVWTENAAGLRHSYEHGYGVLTGWRLVQAAKVWPLVPPMNTWRSPKIVVNKHTSNYANKRVSSAVAVPRRLPGVLTVEHVQVMVWIAVRRRGALKVVLTSPNGTESVLATPRAADVRTHGLKQWNFSTVRCWGETPNGEWQLTVEDTDDTNQHGVFREWRLTLHGTVQTPDDVQDRRRLIEFASQGSGPSSEQVLGCSASQLSNIREEFREGDGDGISSSNYPLVIFFIVLAGSLVAFMVYFVLACGGPLWHWVSVAARPAIMKAARSAEAAKARALNHSGDERGGYTYSRLANVEEGTGDAYSDWLGLDSSWSAMRSPDLPGRLSPAALPSADTAPASVELEKNFDDIALSSPGVG